MKYVLILIGLYVCICLNAQDGRVKGKELRWNGKGVRVRAYVPTGSTDTLYLFSWSGVTNPMAQTVWTTYGNNSSTPATYVSPIIPGTLGTPSIASRIGSNGFEINGGYNTEDSVSTKYERYTSTPSLHMILDPFTPAIPTGMYDSGIGGQGASNARSEVTLNPFHYLYAVPSEIWVGWSYYFPTVSAGYDPWVSVNYSTNGLCAEGNIHQEHASNVSPQVLWWYHAGWGNKLVISVFTGNASSPTENLPCTGMTPQPIVGGVWMDFVEHIIWDLPTGGTGKYEAWCTVNGVTTKFANMDATHNNIADDAVTNTNGATVYTYPNDGNPPYGGTPKFGIYHAFWHSLSPANADSSLVAMGKASPGCTKLETYISPIKFEYNLPGNYDSNGYSHVHP
jgi:hypothetical protein